MQFPCNDCEITKTNGNNDLSICENCEEVDRYNNYEEKRIRNEKMKKIRKPIIEAKIQELLL